MNQKFLLVLVLLVSVFELSNAGTFAIGRLKYSGGGDWYGDPTSLVNLQNFIADNIGIDVAEKEAIVSLSDEDLFSYPYLYMTGHGGPAQTSIFFSDWEAERLREYLSGGGFLHCDDNYGLDKAFRRELKKVFPDKELVEIPFDHPIFHIAYDFPDGLPKIHEHDNKPPQGFGIIVDGRIVVFYSYESDLGDGWEDPEVHNDTEEKRQAALKMGTNIIIYALSGINK